MIVAPAALAAAGGGSAGFNDGGGGGGGGGGGNGFALYVLLDVLIHIAVLGHGLGALVLIALALIWFFARAGCPCCSSGSANRAANRTPGRHRSSKRERSVEAAAAEAAEDDPDFAPDRVKASARDLFVEIEKAWDAGDRMPYARPGRTGSLWWSGSGAWTTSSSAAGAITCSRSASRRSNTSA